MSGGRIAVLGVSAGATPLAAALALRARSRAGVPAAVVVLWRAAGEDQPAAAGGAPAGRAARRLAARLASRDLPATARGRLAWVVLGDDAAEGVRALRRVEAAAGDAPVVLALSRPRDRAIDAVLADSEEVVVATAPDSPVARAALEDLADLGVPCRACAPPAGTLRRLGALAGLRTGRVPDADEPAAPGVARGALAAERA